MRWATTANMRVLEHCSRALRNLTHNDNNQVAIAEQGGIRAILDAMGNHSRHTGVLEECSRVLSSLAANADNKGAIAEQGGIRAVRALLDAIGNHSRHTGVLEPCCRALSNLAYNFDCGWSYNANNQVAIEEQGGIRARLGAMGNHSRHTGVLEPCSRALSNLVYDNANTVTKLPSRSKAASEHSWMRWATTAATRGCKGVVAGRCWKLGGRKKTCRERSRRREAKRRLGAPCLPPTPLLQQETWANAAG
jgi:hypothetical protein